MDIRSFMEKFAGSGTRNKLIRRLIMNRMNIPEATLFAHPETEIPDHIRRLLDQDVSQLDQGAPMGYITGKSEFMSWSFRSDARALCPRLETEEFCRKIIASYRSGDSPNRILDLGCGSGVLGLTLALTFPKAKVMCTDIDKQALELTQDNIKYHHLENQVSCCQSDWWDALQDAGTFDLVVSNPPYISLDESVEPGVLKFEPSAALFSKNGGMEAITSILSAIHHYLRRPGIAAFELNPLFRDRLDLCLCDLGIQDSCRWHEDQFGRTRFLFYEPE